MGIYIHRESYICHFQGGNTSGSGRDRCRHPYIAEITSLFALFC